DSRPTQVLSLDISSTLPKILGQLELPEGWIASIIDRQGHLIGRSRDPARFIGVVARPEFSSSSSRQTRAGCQVCLVRACRCSPPSRTRSSVAGPSAAAFRGTLCSLRSGGPPGF